jgi:hypothetical protein
MKIQGVGQAKDSRALHYHFQFEGPRKRDVHLKCGSESENVVEVIC